MANTNYDPIEAINPLRPIGPSDPIPWKDRSVTVFWMEGGVLQQTHTITGKRLALAQPRRKLMAAWTGQWKTDLIPVDRAALKEALG